MTADKSVSLNFRVAVAPVQEFRCDVKAEEK
jgi:hypothetical protein